MSLEEGRRDPSPADSASSAQDVTPRPAEDGSVPSSSPEHTSSPERTEPVVAPAAPYTPVDDPYGTYDDPYGYTPYTDTPAVEEQAVAKQPESPPPPPPPPAATSDGDDGDHDEEGMLRMSFLEHLEELRSRLIRAI